MSALGHWLATPQDQGRTDWVKRFDPRFWTVNFPRPMMAAATTPAPDTVRVDLAFLRRADLAGLIWGERGPGQPSAAAAGHHARLSRTDADVPLAIWDRTTVAGRGQWRDADP